jgi:hypothetical protein
MRINQYPTFKSPTLKASPGPSPEKSNPEPQDTMNGAAFSLSKADLANFGAGVAVGAIGIGSPAALGMGAVKAFATGNYLWGAGLGLAAAGTASVTVVPSLAVAAMSSDGGDRNGIRGFFTGAALSTAAAAVAIF